MTDADLTVTAYHEAGHATTNALLGLPFDRVSVLPRAGVRIGAHNAAGYAGPHLALRRAVSDLSGDAAVEVWSGRPDPCAIADWAHAHSMLTELADAPAIECVHQVALLLMRRNRTKLDAIAAQLLRHHELRYADVLVIVRERQETAATVLSRV